MNAKLSNQRSIQLTALLLFFLSLVLTAYTTKFPSSLSIIRKTFLEVFSPIGKSSTTIIKSFEYLWDQYIFLVNTESKNRDLEARLRTLMAENARLSEVLHENSQLKTLLGVKEKFAWRVIVSKIIGHAPSQWAEVIVINKGTADGVKVGLPVVEGDAIVGKVVFTSSSASQVLLITDRNSGVDAFIQSTRARGIFTGSGNNIGSLQFIKNDTLVQVGDTVVSSGIDGIYPKGIIIGTVISTEQKEGDLFQEIKVQTKMKDNELENLLVILSDEQSSNLNTTLTKIEDSKKR